MESEHLYELEYRFMDSLNHHHAKLSAHERDLITVWNGGGISLREIARRLGRSPSTISEEIKRNSYKGYYVAIHAQAVTEERKVRARKRHPLKDPQTYACVLEKLRDGWSPEQIAGRLRKENGKTIICHETIYQFIYSAENKDKKLWEYLPRKQVRRKKKWGRKVKRERIPERVSIHQRPEIVNQRLVFGHWEGDNIVGKGGRDGIRTEVERLSRYTLAVKLSRLTAEKTVQGQKHIFSSLSKNARHSTTIDNGQEHVKHIELKDLGMRTYFADPYSSWQRGTNEYHNGLIRRYLPKRTSFADLTQEELDDIIWEINNRPRKILNYNTPEEIFNSYLGVRIQS